MFYPPGQLHSTRRRAPSRRVPSRRRGFSLIEVLSTILLISIVVPVAMQAVSTAMTGSSVARHRNEAAGLAEFKIAQLISSGDWQNGSQSGPFDGDNPDYTWDAQVNNWTQPNVQELEVRVYWTTGRRGQESIAVSTLVYLNNSQNALGGGTTQ